MASHPGEAVPAATDSENHAAEAASEKVAEPGGPRDSAAAARFARFCEAVTRRLPFGLSRVVPPTLLGFAIINGSTFSFDLLLLTALRSGLGWPVEVAFTIAYSCALALAYVLNRIFNFRSHAPVGKQAVLYVVAVVINYVALVLGVGAGLAGLGVPYQLSRLLAGLCEAAFMYCAMRWVIFRGERGRQARES
ncbi:GtrA family protein [Myceligenerans crystallogenes]|uniref:GtrA/DPMS transmembrane domain-containing protein n=1 Tax=Myceligenerans crystallogenes TaxID=316335 RepID=A0ABP4ZJA1_9MICO